MNTTAPRHPLCDIATINNAPHLELLRNTKAFKKSCNKKGIRMSPQRKRHLKMQAKLNKGK